MQNYVLLYLYKYAQYYEEKKNLGEGYTGVCHTNGRWGGGDGMDKKKILTKVTTKPLKYSEV